MRRKQSFVPCFLVMAMSLLMGLGGRTPTAATTPTAPTAPTAPTRKRTLKGIWSDSDKDDSDKDDNVLVQVGSGDIAPQAGGELCFMDMTPDGKCIAQTIYGAQEEFGRVTVFCRNDSSWEIKGGGDVNAATSGSTAKKYCSAIAMSDTAHRVAVADEETGVVDIYEDRSDDSTDDTGSSWKLMAEFTGGTRFGSTLDMNDAGTRLVVGDDENKRYHAYELLEDTSNWTQVHVHTSSTADYYAHAVAIKADGSVFAVSSRDLSLNRLLQVHLVEWDSWTTTTFSSFFQPSSGQIVDGVFSGDGTRYVLTVNAHQDEEEDDDDDDMMEIHEISGFTHVGLVSYLNLGTAATNRTQGRTALNQDGTLLAISDPHAQDSKGILWLLRLHVAFGNYVTVATLAGSEPAEGLGRTVKLSADGLTLVTNTMPSSAFGEQSPSWSGNLKVFDVNLGPAPTMAPTKETFVVRYAGNAIAGFGGHFQGNEVTVPFLVSPHFNKEVTLLMEDCQTELPSSLMMATQTERPANNGGNLLHLNVNLELNLPNIGALQTNQLDDSLWKGQEDSSSNILSFCVRVDLMTTQDILTGDGLTDKTSVNFEAVHMQVVVDFFAQVPAVAAVLDGSEFLPPIMIEPEVYGVTGCHCNPVNVTCYDNDISPAPALTPQDTLDVCFHVSAEHVGIAEITSLPVSQGNLWFDPIQAGPNFFTAVYKGSVAIFMSRLPSAFFRNVDAPIGATATIELYFNETNEGSSGRARRLGTSRSPRQAVTPTRVVDGLSADSVSSASSRHLQDITQNPNFGLDVAVQIQVQGVRLTLGEGNGGAGATHHVIVPASVYGVSACHCHHTTLTCYNNSANSTPALGHSDTLNVCFFVASTGVSIAQVASFTVTQGPLRFDSVVAGNGFYTEEYLGDSAIFRSEIPSPFFNDATMALSATATVELRFVSISGRALGVPSFSASQKRRRLQDLSSNANLAVVLEVDGVRLDTLQDGVNRMETDNNKEEGLGFLGQDPNVTIWIAICLVFSMIVVLLALNLRARNRPQCTEGKENFARRRSSFMTA